MSDEEGPLPPKQTGLIRRDLTVLIALAGLVTSALLLVVDVSKVASTSMVPTLRPGDRVVINRLPSWLSASPSRGDVIVFHDPGRWLSPDDRATYGDELIKRVVGVGGDTVTCCDRSGRLVVNGVSIDEPYLADQAANADVEFTVHVRPGYVWVEGDNRQYSSDSRAHIDEPGGGQVRLDAIVGTVPVRIEPLSRIGLLGQNVAFDAVDSHQ